jgi:exodeoxyribonuclease-3
MESFKVATYNVNSVRSRLHIVIPWLRENSPDVLCMQETKVEDSQFPVSAFEDIGYQVIFRGAKKYNGVAIASKKVPSEVLHGFHDDGPTDGDRLVAARFSGVVVVNSYVPQGRERDSVHFSYKLQWFQRLGDFFANHWSLDTPLVWCGDLNVAPENIDVHDPKRLLGHVCFTPEVWDAYSSVKSWGLEDIYRRHHAGETGHYTFFDYRVPNALQRGLGWRIDHILATPPFAARSLSCEIDLAPRAAEKPSDHTIMVAEFDKTLETVNG